MHNYSKNIAFFSGIIAVILVIVGLIISLEKLNKSFKLAKNEYHNLITKFCYEDIVYIQKSSKGISPYINPKTLTYQKCLLNNLETKNHNYEDFKETN